VKRAAAVFALICAFMLAPARPASANTVEALFHDRDNVGRTVVTVVCRSPLAEGSYRSYRLESPPRAVLVLEDLTETMDPDELTVGNRHIERVRIVHHPERTPPELLFVFDLATDSARILEIRRDGNRLTTVVGGGSFPTPAVAPRPTITPTPPPPPPSRTPLPVPTLSPTPSPTPAPPSSPQPTYPDRPAPPVVPPIPRPPAETPTPNPSPGGVDGTPTPDSEPSIASRVVDITVSARSDGSTLLRITADGTIPQGRARYIEVAGEPPRVVVTIRGLSAVDLPRTMEIDSPGIDRIRLIQDAETIEGELHVVIHLARAGIGVETMQQVGPHLVFLLVSAD
jgi:hypothetical protein